MLSVTRRNEKMKEQGTWNHELWQGGEGRKKRRLGEGGKFKS
jgi:hypothetical protein